MTKQILKHALLLLCLPAVLTACKQKVEIVEEIRAIKTVTVKEQAAEQIRKLSGIVAAVDSSGLSFEVAGRVVSVEVDIGDRVKKDQVLAALDPETYELKVAEVKAELAKARDNATKTKAEYERQQRIFEQGAGAKRFVEVSQYNYKAAQSAVKVQAAKLDNAQRDLRKTKLLAPYDGTIAWRAVEPNEEVPTGKKVLEINATGEMEVELAVPETTVDRINIGDSTTVTFPTLPDESVRGRISYIGSAAVKANAFPVKVGLINPKDIIKPGMTAEASLSIEDENRQQGFIVPVKAVLPGSEPNQGHAFVYDADSSTVKKTPVRFGGTQEGKAIVSEGLAAGDVIAVAGVSFLADGLKVKLMQPQ